MMTFERIFYYSIVLIFLVVCISFVIPQFPVAVVSLGFCILWFAWYAILVFEPDVNPKKLFCSWWAINFSILIMFLSVWHTVGDYSNDSGSELGWFIAYMPVIIPTGLATTLLPLISDIESTLKPYIGFTMSAWVQFTILAAIQSTLLFILITKIKCLVHAKKPNKAIKRMVFKVCRE